MFLLPLLPTAIQAIGIIYHRELRSWEQGGNGVCRLAWSVPIPPGRNFSTPENSSKTRNNSGGWFSTSWPPLFPLIGNFGRSQSQSNRFCHQGYFALTGCYSLRNIPHDTEKHFPSGLNTQMIVGPKDTTQQCPRAAQTKFLCNADFSQKLIYDKGCLNWAGTVTSVSGCKNKKKGRKRRIKLHCFSKALPRSGSDTALQRLLFQ